MLLLWRRSGALRRNGSTRRNGETETNGGSMGRARRRGGPAPVLSERKSLPRVEGLRAGRDRVERRSQTRSRFPNVLVIGVLLDPWRRPKAGGPPAERLERTCSQAPPG